MSVESLITEQLDVWTSAIENHKASGRGSRNKLNLYGIKKLRGLILELAVRGQLVPQDPSDEPASVLLEKIASEKTKLIKEGNIKKQKALPPIEEDEKPYNLLEGWEYCRLGDLGLTSIGLTYSPKDINDKGIPILRSTNIQNGKICFNDLVRVETTIKRSLFLSEGDLLNMCKKWQ